MGFAIAQTAAQRGAEVTTHYSGPVTLPTPANVLKRIDARKCPRGCINK